MEKSMPRAPPLSQLENLATLSDTSLEQKVIGKKVVGATPLFFRSLTQVGTRVHLSYWCNAKSM